MRVRPLFHLADQFVLAMDIQFPVNALCMRLGGAFGNEQFIGNFRQAVALRKKLDYFDFALRQFVLAHAFAWNSCGGIRRAIESFIARIRLLSQRQHSERYNNKSHQGKQNHQHERFQRQQPFIRGRAQNPGHHYVADEPRRHFGQNTADKKQWYGRDPSLRGDIAEQHP